MMQHTLVSPRRLVTLNQVNVLHCSPHHLARPCRHRVLFATAPDAESQSTASASGEPGAKRTDPVPPGEVQQSVDATERLQRKSDASRAPSSDLLLISDRLRRLAVTLPGEVWTTLEAGPSGRQQAEAASTKRPPAPITAQGFANELLSGQLWTEASASFPRVPWGALQLALVMLCSAFVVVVALLIVALEMPLASKLFASEAPTRADALLHLGIEAACALSAGAVLLIGLGRSKPRSKGMFSFSASAPDLTAPVLLLCALAFPLADTALYQGSLWAEKTFLDLPGPSGAPAVLAEQLRASVAAGDLGSVAMHFLASCGVGPLWEEVFWRGFFLASMTRVLPLPACVAVSSGVFSALHYAPGNLLPIFFLSALCDALYLRSSTLAAPLLLHGAWNAYQLIGMAWLGKDVFV